MRWSSAVAAVVVLGAYAAATARQPLSQPARPDFHNCAPGGGVNVTLPARAQTLTDTAGRG